jgi:hypothetical protein
MSNPKPRVARAAVLLAALGALALRAPEAHAGFSVLWIWPGSAPCNGTLQACVDNAAPGDGIAIETNTPIDESISFSKSLTLSAGGSFQPSFAAGRSIQVSLPASPTIEFVGIEGLSLQGGHISIVQSAGAGAGGLNVQVMNDAVTAGDLETAIDIQEYGNGPLDFTVTGNSVDKQGSGAAIQVLPSGSGVATGSVADNSLYVTGSAQATGIGLTNDDGELTADVIANRVVGSGYGTGIDARQSGAGTSHVRILDNLVRGADAQPGSFAITAYASAGTLDATIVNNTAADSDQGIFVGGPAATVTGLAANNAITGDRVGLNVDPSGGTLVPDRNNLFFGNQVDLGDGEIQVTPGPGTVFADPLEAGCGGYTLRPGSPAIDAGDSSAVPADLTTDLGGDPRIVGNAVDIGAFEARPQALTWPGAPPCAGTLQACLDAAVPGSVLEIATDGPIDESPHFAKELTLRAAAGSTPVFSAGHTLLASCIEAGGDGRIDIEGLTFAVGSIRVVQLSPTPMTARLVGNTMTPTQTAPALWVYGANSGIPHGLITVDVSDNHVSVPLGGAQAVKIELDSDTSAQGRIADNVIDIDSPTTAIQLGSGDSVDLDVVANHVSGSGYVSAIRVSQGNASGTTTTRILDNLVTGQAADTGAGAVVLAASAGTLDAQVVNNTIADDQNGLVIQGDAGTTVSGLVANNIVSGSSESGLVIDVPGSALANRYNLVFGNGSDSFTAGPGTLTVDPLFVGGGDYHLQAASPAVDSGDDAAVPVDLPHDLDGGPRIAGGGVDLGAYEVPEAPAPLAAGAAALALAALARRPAAAQIR